MADFTIEGGALQFLRAQQAHRLDERTFSGHQPSLGLIVGQKPRS